MKKVTNITLGGIIFAMEQDAYEALAAYLEKITQHLQSNADATEIVADIEIAIAEKFHARKRNEKMAVTIADVESVINEMGSPAAFSEGEATDESQVAAAAPATEEPKRRLYRDTDDAILGGVASGLARYFNVDPVIVRIVFVLAVFLNGIGILAYIILWLIVPAAETTAEKYAMRGDAMTLKDITERVKKNLEHLEKVDVTKARGFWSRVRDVCAKAFEILGAILRVCFQVCRYIIGIALVLGGALAIAGLVSVYSFMFLSDKVLMPLEVQTALEILMGSTLGIVALASSFVMMTIPLLVAIMVGASCIAKKNFFTVAKTISLLVVWIIAAMLAFTSSALQVERVTQELDARGLLQGTHINIDWYGHEYLLPPESVEYTDTSTEGLVDE